MGKNQRRAERTTPTTLFPISEPEPEPDLSADQKRTRRQKQLIEAGINPGTNLRIIDNGETCGSCAHAYSRSHYKVSGNRYWWKCELAGDTHGPGTDIRKWWPACIKWVRLDT